MTIPTSALPESVARVRTLSYIAAAIGAVSLIIGTVVAQSLSPTFIGGVIGIIAYLYLASQVVARKDWARIVIGILAILGVVANIVTAFSAFGMIALLSSLGENSLTAVLVFGAVLALVDAVVLVILAVAAFAKNTAAWCQPVSPTSV